MQQPLEQSGRIAMHIPNDVPRQRLPDTAAAPKQYCFGLIHGAWHSGECWVPLQEELSQRGHGSVAPNLPVEDVSATIHDDAEAVLRALDDERHVVLVGHSRGGDVVPHVVGRLPLERLVAVIMLNHGGPRDFEPDAQTGPSRRYTEQFLTGIELHPENDDLTVFRADRAQEVFYHHVREADLVVRAIAGLRPQRLLADPAVPSPALPPELPLYVVMSDEDHVFQPGRIERVAHHVYGTEPITIAGDHTPQLSNPGPLAEILVSLADAAVLRQSQQ